MPRRRTFDVLRFERAEIVMAALNVFEAMPLRAVLVQSLHARRPAAARCHSSSRIARGFVPPQMCIGKKDRKNDL